MDQPNPTPWSRLGKHLQHFLEDETDPVIGHWAVGQGTDAPDRQLLRHLLRFLSEASSEEVSVLEVGCGSGIQLRGLIEDGLEPGAVSFTGYDFTPELVDLCRENFPGRRFEVRDMLTMSDERTADVVVSRAVLEHIEDGKVGLANLFRATRVVTVVSWFMRPTWNDAEAGIEIADGFVNQRYATRDVLAFVREQCRPALLCRFDFDHHVHDWSVWLLWREAPPEGALAAVHAYLASEEFERAALPRTSDAAEANVGKSQIVEDLHAANRSLEQEPALVQRPTVEAAPERLTADMFGVASAGHEARYCIAAGFLRRGDIVIDAACGIAFGATLLRMRGDVTYYGVDKDLSHAIVPTEANVHLIEADLVTWTPDFAFDIAVGFETIEHLSDYSVYLRWARRARRFVLLSVPIVPTVGVNPFHLHDFQRDDLIELFADDEWRLFQFFEQPSEVAGIYVFARNGITPMPARGRG